MIKYIGAIIAAVIGLFFVRRGFYFRTWGHGGGLQRLILLGLGGLLIWPMAAYGTPTVYWLTGMAVVFLCPIRQILLWRARAMGINGATRLAREMGGEVEKKDDFFTVKPQSGTDGPEWWVGNVLTRARSLHPGVSTTQTYYMMAFAVMLKHRPQFCLSFMRGWDSPKYFVNEWRETTVMQGQMFAMSMGDLLSDGPQRDTGGNDEPMQPLTEQDIGDIKGFNAGYCTAPQSLFDILDPQLLGPFQKASSQTLQFEFNITPTSVNIYTTYCKAATQKDIMEFLLALADKIHSMPPGEPPAAPPADPADTPPADEEGSAPDPNSEDKD